MKEKKCILLVRVSTEAQSFDEQEKELYSLALKCGYSKENILAISEHESGIKLDEENRRGLNRMKEAIATGEYDCVFAWEISRIARKKKILFSILEYLTERGIQLVIKEPNIQLLKLDGTVDEGAETIFTLYAQIAETEMRNKKARFDRAKKEYYAKGKYMGGKFLLGYTKNKEGFWAIDEKTAPLVRLIFDLYISGEYSMTELAKELHTRGYFNHLSLTNLKCVISRILKNESYIGKRALVYRHKKVETIIEGVKIEQFPSFQTYNNNIYPQLIDDETWEKCVERRKNNRHKPKARNAQYLLTPIIHCQCGASYCVNCIDATYECRIRHNGVEKNIDHDPGIGINMIESLVWYVVLQELHKDMAKEKSSSREVYEKEINILQQKKVVSENAITDAMEKRSQLDEAYFVHSRFTKERYESLALKQNEIIEHEQSNIRKYDGAIRNYLNLINTETTFDDMINTLSQSFDSIREGTDLDVMKSIISRYIVDIHVKKMEGKPGNLYKEVTIETINDHNNMLLAEKMKELKMDLVFTNTYYIDSLKRRAYFDAEMTDEVPMVYMNRIERKRVHTTRNGKKQSVWIDK